VGVGKNDAVYHTCVMAWSIRALLCFAGGRYHRPRNCGYRRQRQRCIRASQRGAILLAGATQLETWASQMRTEAADLADG